MLQIIKNKHGNKFEDQNGVINDIDNGQSLPLNFGGPTPLA